MIDKLIFYEFHRENIENFEIEKDLIRLQTWIVSKEISSAYLHRVIFAVDGYDYDRRGLSQIPEVICFFKELTTRWPYMFNFCYPHSDNYAWLFQLLYLQPVIGIDEQKIHGHLDERNLRTFFSDWLTHANRLQQNMDIAFPHYQQRQSEMFASLGNYISDHRA